MNPVLVLILLVTGFWTAALLLDRMWQHAPAARRHALLAGALVLGALLPLGLLSARAGMLPRWPLPVAPQARGDAGSPEEPAPSSTPGSQVVAATALAADALGFSGSQSCVSASPNLPSMPSGDITLDGRSGVAVPLLPKPAFAQVPTQPDPTSAAASRPWVPRLIDAVMVAWLAGGVIALALLALRLLALRRWRRYLLAAPVLSWDAELSALVHRRTGLRRLPELRQDLNLAIPALLGWRRPLLVLPADPVLLADAPRLRQVLLHECAHAARGDAAWALLAALVQAVWWWHPVLRRLVRRLELAREECCDAMAVVEADHDAVRGYAATLLSYASRPCGPALAPALSGAELEHRLTHLLKGREAMSRHPRLVAALCVLPLASLALLGCGLIAAEPEQVPVPVVALPDPPVLVPPAPDAAAITQADAQFILLTELQALRAEQAALREQLAAANAAKDAKIQALETELAQSSKRSAELNHIAQTARAVAFQLNVKLAEVEDALKQREALSLQLPSEVVSMTIVQRQAQAIPGSQERIRVQLGDITAGQVELAIRDEQGMALLEPRSMKEGDTAIVAVAGKEFHVALRELHLVLFGDDTAVVLVASRALTEAELAVRAGAQTRQVRSIVGSDQKNYYIILDGKLLLARRDDAEGPLVWQATIPDDLEGAEGGMVNDVIVTELAVGVRIGPRGQFVVDLLTGNVRTREPLAVQTLGDAEKLLEQKDYDAAIATCEGLLRDNRNQPEVQELLARARRQRNVDLRVKFNTAQTAVVAAAHADAAGKQILVAFTLPAGHLIGEGSAFTIHRGGNYIVRVRIDRVAGDMAFAAVLPETWNAKNLPIEPGDLATDRLF